MSRRKEYYQHPLKEDLATTNLWVDWELRTIYEIKKTIYKITFVSPSGYQGQMSTTNSTSYSKTRLLSFSCLFEIVNDFYLCLVKKSLCFRLKIL